MGIIIDVIRIIEYRIIIDYHTPGCDNATQSAVHVNL